MFIFPFNPIPPSVAGCFKRGMCDGEDNDYRNGYFRGYFEQMNLY